MFLRRSLLAIMILVPLVSSSAQDHKEWYCDPVNGSTPTSPKDVGKGDGSRERPWGSFESVIKAKLINGSDSTKAKVHAGDTIKLLGGDHGKISFQTAEYQNTDTITVEAAEGESPMIGQLSVKFAQSWAFRGITFQRPEDSSGKGYMLFRGVDVEGFTVDRCRIQSTNDATKWTDEEWVARCAQYGVWLSGSDCKITDCDLYAVENGIAIDGVDFLVENNRIEYFLNDGIEHCATNARITRNRITDQYNLDSNVFHHDGIQGWSLKGVHQTNVVIDSNFVARSTGKFETIPPMSTNVFQGITIFDGPFSDVTISNNIVMTTASHAISLYGCTDSVIESNTVIYQGMTPLKPCWIGVFVGKPKWGSFEPSGIIVRGNIAPTYAFAAINSITPSPGIKIEGNYSFKAPNKPYQAAFTIVDPAQTFVKYNPLTADFDLAIKKTSPAADKVIKGAGARQ